MLVEIGHSCWLWRLFTSLFTRTHDSDRPTAHFTSIGRFCWIVCTIAAARACCRWWSIAWIASAATSFGALIPCGSHIVSCLTFLGDCCCLLSLCASLSFYVCNTWNQLGAFWLPSQFHPSISTWKLESSSLDGLLIRLLFQSFSIEATLIVYLTYTTL